MMGIVENTLKDGYPSIKASAINKKIDDFEGISDYQLCGDHDIAAGTDHTSLDLKNISNTVQKDWNNDVSLAYLFDLSQYKKCK